MTVDRMKELIELALGTSANGFISRCPGCYLLVDIPGGDGDDDDLEYNTEIVDPFQINKKITNNSKQSENGSDDAKPGTYLYEVKKHANNGWLDWIAIGRARNNDVIIRHQSVSKLHARIHSNVEADSAPESDPQFWITDMNSSSGTWTNRNMLESSKPRQLSIGDAIRFGQVNCKFLSGQSLRLTILGQT